MERRGLSITDLLTLLTFSVVRAVRGRPVDVLFISDPVVRNDSTHRSTVSRSGIASSRAILNCRRKIRWTVTTESLFLKKLLDDKNAVLKFHCCMATELIPSELFSGGVWRSPTFTLPTTTHLKEHAILLRHSVYACGYEPQVTLSYLNYDCTFVR